MSIGESDDSEQQAADGRRLRDPGAAEEALDHDAGAHDEDSDDDGEGADRPPPNVVGPPHRTSDDL